MVIDTYRGWPIEETWLGDYVATHPDFDPTPIYPDDGPSDNRYVTAKTIGGLMAEVDEWIDEHPATHIAGGSNG